MSTTLNTVAVLDSVVDRQVVETLLTSSPGIRVLEYLELDDDSPNRTGEDILVVACGEFSDQVAEYIEHASADRPGRPVVLLAPLSSNGYVSTAFSRGADDVATLPLVSQLDDAGPTAAEFAFTLEKAVARRRGNQAVVERGLGDMICVLGLKGGSGKTLTAVNLGVSLADRNEKVVLVDLDLQFGDVGLALGLKPARTLYDLARAGGSLDAEKVADFMELHSSGLRALLAPTRPDQAGLITADFLREVFRILRETNDYVIVDTPPGFTPEVIAAVDSSTAVCMVAMLDSLSLKNTKLGLETLELMEYASEKVRLVLNRADSKVGITSEDVVAVMGRPPAILVPSDRNITRSINQGEPIALTNRRTDAARAFHTLADLYAGGQNGKPPATAARRRRLFGTR